MMIIIIIRVMYTKTRVVLYRYCTGTVPVLAGTARTKRISFRKYLSSVIGKQDIKMLQNRAISEKENVLRIVLK